MSRQPPSAAFHKSKTLEGKYIIGDEIGKGAYGRVYKGLDLENGDFVAIKQVSLQNIAQEDLNVIMQEIDLLKNLNHKNIVKYLGSLKTKTDLHIILEYVENGSLANIIKPNKFGPFPESLVSVYISQVLEGLVYLHEQGVIHRDIKGANILTTKEGLVKLADFGVATKLTEADVNTHSVVGTPYWMAPEVIEMSGVCAASDVWSVGCTVIELLTCVPPYFDLQPMPALFRIVQDEQPPIPEGLSPAITDFLCQCFKKDARHRPDAKTLLSHPWIQNSRRALQTSLRHTGTIRSLKKMGLEESQASNGDDPVTAENPAEKGSTELEATNVPEIGRSMENDGANVNPNEEIADQVDNDSLHGVPSLAIRQVQMNSDRISANDEAASSSSLGAHGSVLSGIVTNGDIESSNTLRKDATKQVGGKKSSAHNDNGLESQVDSPGKVVKTSIVSGEYELSKFSDTPGDASLDDLLPLLGRSLREHSSAGASTSTSSLARQESVIDNSGRTDLATTLRAAIAQNQRENESGQAHGGDILHLMMGVLKEDGMRSESLAHLQAVEFSKLVSSLRPDEPEDAIVSACQKLTFFFQQRPEQKFVFVSQHGFLPLVELLEVPKTPVMCSVLQVLNQIIKDNTDFQVNACLVGLIPIAMGFALPDRPYEVRMEAAYFLQQLCQSSSLTLQMFMACRGIPILVGFLEADYAKYRELVHMAIDGMWQIFKLQQSTSRNDFCRIASKNGILLRLVNTLYSMSEASRLETLSSGGGFPSDGLAQKPRSGALDPSNPSFLQPDIPLNGVDQPEILRSKQGVIGQVPPAGVQEPARASTSQFPESLLFPLDSEKERSSNASPETSGCSTGAVIMNLPSTDRPPKLTEGVSNGVTSETAGHQENVRPLLSLLEKEPPSRRYSGQLEFARHLSGLEKQESILPLIHSSDEKKSNGMEFLMNEFAEASGRGRENAYMGSSSRSSLRTGSKKVGLGLSNDGMASTSEIGSQTASGALTGSGVLNARPGSATSSGLLSHTLSPWNADVAREYLEKVADLMLEFAAADTRVKSYMCSQSLLTRLFQMFNKIEPPILLKVQKRVQLLILS
ncbi:hypothetical protein Leryth_002936 [Lithospermum erythrorhizon]|nr:hypothetical protein Leryth_002936 [Lithospermum erythrorhizon]